MNLQPLRRIEVTNEEYQMILRNRDTSYKFSRSFQDLLRICGRCFCLDPERLLEKTRRADIVTARNLAMYLLKKNTKMKLEEIGALFNKDHSTVIYAVKCIMQKTNKNEKFEELINEAELEWKLLSNPLN